MQIGIQFLMKRDTMKRSVRSTIIRTLAAGALMPLWSAAPPALASATDYTPYAIPSIPQPAKGTTYNDPVFGTRILRVTDAGDGSASYVTYSYWSIFNVNSTRFFTVGDGGVLYL